MNVACAICIMFISSILFVRPRSTEIQPKLPSMKWHYVFLEFHLPMHWYTWFPFYYYETICEFIRKCLIHESFDWMDCANSTVPLSYYGRFFYSNQLELQRKKYHMEWMKIRTSKICEWKSNTSKQKIVAYRMRLPGRSSQINWRPLNLDKQ